MAQRPESAARWSFEKILALSLSAAMAVYSFWLASDRTWKPDHAQLPDGFSGNFFREQAVAILHGRLWVPERDFASECFIVAGKCYGYFGIFPSLIRLPFFLILRSTQYSLAPVSIALAAGIGTWAILDMARHALDSPAATRIPRPDRILIIIVTSLLLAGGGSLVNLSQAKVYREASIWMVALMLLAFATALRWTALGGNKYLVITLIAGIGATNSRPSAIPAMVALGVWLYFREHRIRRSFTVRLDSLSFAIIVLPAVTAFTIMYLKFNQLSPPSKAWADYLGPGPTMIRQLNGGAMQGPRFIPTNIVQYLRPDSVKYGLSQPWATSLVPDEKAAILLPPIVTNGILTEPTASITNTMPIPLLLTMFTATISLWRTRVSQLVNKSETLPLLVAAIVAAPLALMMYSTTNRYVGDFFPILVIGTIFGGAAACTWLNEHGRLRVALYSVAPLGLYFALVQYSLNVGGWAPVG